MTGPERLLYHQIHPLKLLVDWISAALSLCLFWRRRLWSGLLMHLVPPIAVSTVLLRWGDLEPQRRSTFGRYVARSMSPSMQAVRLAGDAVMALGAWSRRPGLIVVGLLLILFGWLRGALVVTTDGSIDDPGRPGRRTCARSGRPTTAPTTSPSARLAARSPTGSTPSSTTRR